MEAIWLNDFLITVQGFFLLELADQIRKYDSQRIGVCSMYVFRLEMIFKCRVRERLIWKPWYVTHRNSQSKYFNELKSFKIFSISRTHLKFNFSKLKNLIEYLKCLSWSETKHSGAMYPSRKFQQSINWIKSYFRPLAWRTEDIIQSLLDPLSTAKVYHLYMTSDEDEVLRFDVHVNDLPRTIDWRQR